MRLSMANVPCFECAVKLTVCSCTAMLYATANTQITGSLVYRRYALNIAQTKWCIRPQASTSIVNMWRRRNTN